MLLLVPELIQDAKTPENELQEAPIEISQNIPPATHNGHINGETPKDVMQSSSEQQESIPSANANGDINEETLQDLIETMQVQSSTGLQSKPSSSDLQDGPLPGDVTDSGPELHGPVAPESDSPVKAALVKTISREYISPATNSSPDVPDEGRAALGVVQEQGVKAVSVEVVQSQPEVSDSPGHVEPVTSHEKVGGYRSSLNIAPSSRRTMAATFSGSRHVSEKTETSVKTVTSTVHRQVVSSKQSYVSTVAIPERDADNVIVSVSPSVTQLQGQSPTFADWESHAFKASNESTTMTRHAVASEVHRTVTQSNGRNTASEFSASRFEQKSPAYSSSSDEKPKVTYEINFESIEGFPGNKQYTIKKSLNSAGNVPRADLEALSSGGVATASTTVNFVSRGISDRSTGDMSPSGSLMEIAKNTVIDEEEEYEEQADQDGKIKPAESDSPEADSDTESFMSAREDITSDTDTAAYMTAVPGGSSTSLDTDAALVDSAADETITPVNSDTEVEDEEAGREGPTTPEPAADTGEDRGRSGTLKGLKEQMTILGSGVTSEGDLGYRGDTEEGLESAEDLRTAGK